MIDPKIKQTHFDVLDKGFVRVVDTMGDDSAIVQAARVSYGEGTKTVSTDNGLIRYLIKHKHTTPLEMCEIKLHIKVPLFIARQWLRHRTASVNEISARYTPVKDEFYIPAKERYAKQSKTNKQCSDFNDGFDASQVKIFDYELETQTHNAKASYDYMLGKELAREVARIQLPVNQYTEFYWKIDLHNLLHFCKLRSASNAQWEVQQYSQIIEGVIKQWCPVAYEAFVDYVKEACTLSRQELAVVKEMLKGYRQAVDFAEHGLSLRESNELIKTFEL